MNDLLSPGPFTLFDVITVVLMLFSGLMAFARGFLREVASIVAFLAAVFAAMFAWQQFGAQAQTLVPEGLSPLIGDAAVILIAFLAVYIITAFLGGRLSKLVHSVGDIGFIDRIIGLVFGVFRGAAVVVLVLLATRAQIEDAQLPWIVDAYTYPYFVQAAEWAQATFPALADRMNETLPDAPRDS